MDPTTEQQNAIAVATIQVEVAHLKAAVADLRTTNAQLNDKLDEVLRTMHEAQGGWRTLMVVGGAAGSIGGFLSWLVSHWKA
ncbi:hypothetical protein [Massilia sp. DD77]|uniref:hypothetical protein n=1 Tax=Massilia sp. DD77 TaxID=3109349 RepID=UPI002FFF93DC